MKPTITEPNVLMPMLPDADWLTPKEVAVCLRVSRWTVYHWIDEGKLPAIQIGRSLRIARSALAPFARTPGA